MAYETKDEVGYTTQRVDYETLDLIKTLNLHLIKSGVRTRQSDIIKEAIRFAKRKEYDFIEYVKTGRIPKPEGVFDTITRVTAKPWFPYGNLLK